MTGIITSGEKRLVIVSGRAHPALADAVARELGTEVLSSTAYDFSNGETYVRFNESVRGCDVFAVQSHGDRVNDWIMEQLIMVDALKRASAKRISVVAPFFPYARQDKKHLGREPISARLVADLYKTAGADRLMSVDLHSSQEQGFFDGPWDHLWAQPVLVDYIRGRIDASHAAVVSPDAGRIRVAERWANALGGTPLAFVHKTRDVTRPNESVANRVVGDVKDRSCVLVDDMIDTGGTIAKAVRVVLTAGAKEVIVAATHGVLTGPAVERLSTCGAKEIVVTDTLPIPAAKRFDRLTVLPIAPLLARAIKAVFDDGSVARLFEA